MGSLGALVSLCAFGAALLVSVALGRADLAKILAGALIGGAAVGAFRGRAEPQPSVQPGTANPDPALDVAFDAIDDPLLLTEHQVITRANAAARRLFGEQVVGEDLRVAVRHPAAAALVETTPVGERAQLILPALGSDARRFELQCTALDGERRLLRLADRATTEVAERMRTDFVANASHELRTPLSTLIGFIETLEDMGEDGPPASRTRFLGIMAREARRMRQLIEDLISLSRIEGERFSAPVTPVALRPLVSEVRAAMLQAQHLPEERIVVTIAGEPVVPGDRGQLAQVLHNLIGNALKYGRPDGPVQVNVRPVTGGRVKMMVADEGEGIPPEHLPRLTERFYRVDPGRSRSLGGTGLGLAIVKHIVERHRGRLAIESEPGQGTRVSVTLPAEQPR